MCALFNFIKETIVMNQKTSSLFFLITLIAFGIILISRSNGSENSRALNCFEVKVTAANEKERPAVNAVNGSGLIGDLCDNRWEYTWTTGPDSNSNKPNPGTTVSATWIKFEFDKAYSIKEMWVWNYNEAIRRGLKNVVIKYSPDGRTWKKLGDYVFAKAPGTVNYAHNTTVDFNGVSAKAVVITAKDGQGVGNYGDKMYGLSEVRFYVAKESGCDKLDSANFIAPPAKLKLMLERGITIDRQVRAIPPEPYTTVSREDIQLIKSMGFEFVKLLINPAVFKSEGGLASSAMPYFDQMVNMVVDENLPVAVCIHPENDFKYEYLANKTQFESLLGFYKELAAYMAKRWNSDQLAFQLMTEPFGASFNPDDWNHWDKLQHQMWNVVRPKMPGYTLILSSDMTGKIEGFHNITPVNDENVMYSFTFYEPHLFSFQGGKWQPDGIPWLKNLPYPSSPESLKSIQNLLAPVPEKWRIRLKAEIEGYANECWNRERLKARIEQLMDWNQYYGRGKLKIWCAEFGCYQGGANPADRARYIEDLRTIFEADKIGWAYWSYNETFSVMTSDRTPMGVAGEQTPDKEMLTALLPDKYKLKKEER